MIEIKVTKPFLPPLEEFNKYLKEIWENKQLTNGGPFHDRFEKELADYLGVKYLSLFSNGTLGLITAIQALKVSGEVITTPFSFVATSHALWWNNIKPVFVDIDPVTFNIDPEKIESAITPKTTAILPVHVFGSPCNVEGIKEIADRYGLKVIYDAAHSFGVKLNGTSLADFGDLAVMSFHATKVFNTFEGGAIISHSREIKEHIDHLKNFGITNETTVVFPGINAKMNEFQAALGILQLKYIDDAIVERKSLTTRYRELLREVPGLTIMNEMQGVNHNYGYFPVLIDNVIFGKTRDKVYEELINHGIYTRRYFFPLISQHPTYRGLESSQPGRLPVAERITGEVLCLPIYPGLEISSVTRICEIITRFRR